MQRFVTAARHHDQRREDRNNFNNTQKWSEERKTAFEQATNLARMLMILFCSGLRKQVT
jgi:hypothetical protein